MKEEEIAFISSLIYKEEVITAIPHVETLRKLLDGEVPGLIMKSAEIKVHDTTKEGRIASYLVTVDLKVKPEVWVEWLNNKH